MVLGDSARGGDWPAWRGPAQTGVSLETGMPSSTKDILWRISCGGRSTPAIVDGRVFAINLSGEGIMEQEQVFAVDLATGHPVWQYRFNVFHTDVPDSRVGWASVAVDPETGYVYAQGVQGMFLCFNRDGKLIWSKSLTELYSRISGFGGRTNTPVIDEDRVIISFNNSSFGAHAVGAHRFLAMDKRTGAVVWWSAPGGRPEDTTYSTPVVAVINAHRLIIAGNADGAFYAIKSRTGEKVWGFLLSQRGINTAAVVDGYRVYLTHSEENYDNTAMGRVVCIDGRGTGDLTKTGELWRADGIDAGYASPLLHGGRLYVMCNSGLLHCFDAVSGKQYWEFPAARIGKGSPAWADGKIYLPTANGTFVILEDTGAACRQLDVLDFNRGRKTKAELFGSPAIADGRVVFFTTTEMVCLGSKDAGPQKVAAVQFPPESPTEDEPTVMLVRPAEVLLKPREKLRFQATAYDKHGRLIKSVQPQWSNKGKTGSVGSDGTFQAGNSGTVGEVTAKFGALTAIARVRVVPDLPISENFESYPEGSIIPWWMGVSKVKHVIKTVDGSKVLEKIADGKGPIFNRSHVFITPPLPAGYTVEADVMGVKEGRRRGDVGLINDRYVLELFGAVQKARVVSWIPGPRFEKKIDFPWAPGRWYRAKLKVDVDAKEGHVYAKIWPRDEAEPAQWTIRAVDPQPNREGSAGLYAHSLAPVYYDNVKAYR
jgi:outer membrane protein assembly factor BamB